MNFQDKTRVEGGVNDRRNEDAAIFLLRKSETTPRVRLPDHTLSRVFRRATIITGCGKLKIPQIGKLYNWSTLSPSRHLGTGEWWLLS